MQLTSGDFGSVPSLDYLCRGGLALAIKLLESELPKVQLHLQLRLGDLCPDL